MKDKIVLSYYSQNTVYKNSFAKATHQQMNG